jgi:transcriptional regulator with XRE-family HTH domain
MNGLEARRLREASGLSQTEFGIALGLSRATIWRIERSSEQLDRKTELAMRYVAERRPARLPELWEIHEAVAQVLDLTAARGNPPFDYRDRLQAAVANLGVSRGTKKAQLLLGKAQAVLGLLNVTPADDPQRERTWQQVRMLQSAWGTVLSDD